MIYTGSRSSAAFSSFKWISAFSFDPVADGLPLRKGFVRPEPSKLFVLPVRQSFVKDSRIMPGTSRLILLLAGWSGRNPDIFTTLGTLGKHLGRSARQIQRYLKDAAEEGYLYFGYRKDRLGYITGLKIRLNPAAVFAPKRSLEKARDKAKRRRSAETRDTTFESGTNEKLFIIKGEMDAFNRNLLRICKENGWKYRLLE